MESLVKRLTWSSANVYLWASEGDECAFSTLMISPDDSFPVCRHPSNSIILPDKGIRSEHIRLKIEQNGQVKQQATGCSSIDAA